MAHTTRPYTQAEIDDALTALIAYAGNATAAIRYLKQEGKRAPANNTLLDWVRTTHWQRYEELRERVALQREDTLVNNYLDASLRATEALSRAVERAIEKLDNDEDDDPARTAANLAKVAQTATDKRLALQGRPTQITESRDASQILRGLIAKHPQVFGISGEAAQLEEGPGDDGT